MSELTEAKGDLAQSTGVTNPLTLLQAMIDKGVDPDALQKMMDLSERWEANQAKKAFQAAMNQVQSELRDVIKATQNKFLENMYVTLEDMQRVAKPVYTRHGFSPSWGQDNPPRDGWVRIVLKLHHIGGHTERYQGDYPQDGTGAKGGKNMNPIQGVVSSCTYGQRNLLQMAFNITVAGEDLDGNNPLDTLIQSEIDQIKELMQQKAINVKKFLAWALDREWKEGDLAADMPRKKFDAAIAWLKKQPQKAGAK